MVPKPAKTSGDGFFQAIVEASSDLVLVLGEHGAIVYVNPAVRRILGYLPDEVIGRSIVEYLHPDDREGATRAIAAEYEGRNELPVMDARVRAKDDIWVPMEGKVWLQPGTDPPRVAIIARDLRERSRAEGMLTERDAWVRAVLEASPVAIVTLDLELQVLEWNALAERMYGWRASDVRGRAHPTLPPASGDADLLREVARTGNPFNDQAAQRLRRDGTMLEVSAAIAPIRSLDGTVTALVEITTDVTGQRALERQFERAQQLEAIGRVARGVARDLEQGLGLVAANAEALLDSGDVRVVGRAHAILEVTRRGSALGAHLADLGERAPRRGSGSAVADQLLRETVEDLEREVRGSARVIAQLGAAEARVAVAPDVLRAVVDLLVRNAVEATPDGGTITLRSYTRSFDAATAGNVAGMQAGSYVVIEVRDTGPGVSPTALARAFEPFFTTKAAETHVGLGLARALSAAHRAGGGLTLVNEEPRGALATLYLPEAAEPQVVAPAAARRSSGPVGEADPTSGGTLRALVVEPDPHIRGLVQSVLDREGFEVITTESLANVREIVASTRITLLVTGVVLAEITGRELARHIRSLQPALKVLYMSSGGSTGAEGRGPQDAMIAKPFTATAFASTVQVLLQL